MARGARGYALSRRAVADLADIFDYSVQKWSVDRARRYIQDLYAAFDALAEGRKSGRDAELGGGILKLQVNSHVVYFTRTGTGPIIQRILHGAMDAPRHLGPERPG